MEISFQINTFWQLKVIANLIGYKKLNLNTKNCVKKLIVLINVKTYENSLKFEKFMMWKK